MRAVTRAVQQLQAGMVLKVSSDLPGMVDAVVVADHAIAGARGNAHSSWSRNVMKSAAQRRPSR